MKQRHTHIKRHRRRRRLKLGEGVRAYYHLMSRTVNGEKWFGRAEKERLRRLIRQVSEFSGITAVTYAVMDNHFHVLAEVPPERSVPDEEIVRRYGILYPRPTPWQPLSAEALGKLLAENGPEGKLLRKDLLRRMHDVSWLMKTIKQRFAASFNASRERFGPVWSERFKSVLVEGDLKALRTVAAYIDLNAVRSGQAEDPKDYRFCGYAEALAGGREARRGLAVLGYGLAGYRQTLFGSGAAPKEGKASLDPRQARKVIDGDRGKLPLHQLLRCRLRYLTDGYVLGSEEFVREASKPLEGLRKKPVRPKPAGPLEGLAVFPGMHGPPEGA